MDDQLQVVSRKDDGSVAADRQRVMRLRRGAVEPTSSATRLEGTANALNRDDVDAARAKLPTLISTLREK
jgi:hypothetical protein